MKKIYILIIILSISLSVEQNSYTSGNYTSSSLMNGNQYSNQYENNQTHNFKDYNCEDIIARRAINSKKPGSTTTEVIISN